MIVKRHLSLVFRIRQLIASWIFLSALPKIASLIFRVGLTDVIFVLSSLILRTVSLNF